MTSAAKRPTIWIALMAALGGGVGIRALLTSSEDRTRVLIHEALEPVVRGQVELAAQMREHLAEHRACQGSP